MNNEGDPMSYEKFEQEKIKLTEKIIINKINDEKNKYISEVEKSHENFENQCEDISANMSEVIKNRDLEQLQKIFSNLSSIINNK